ncbi:hypothetical protein AALP_AA6G328300 [Arabis alpina]|uniref:Uncharacterized protein n=1 Tax=Arabis alpina TaxID=50452 RepID=A0A087GT79_ARAAL|nr:hypothetical protein AALP_AA6G328300 [Arabis alpina]
MDLMVSTSSVQDGFCFIQQSSNLEVLGRTNGNIRSKVSLGSQKRNRLVLFFAASKVESSGLNGRAQKFDNSAFVHSNSNGNGHYTSVNSSFVLEDVESNNC